MATVGLQGTVCAALVLLAFAGCLDQEQVPDPDGPDDGSAITESTVLTLNGTGWAQHRLTASVPTTIQLSLLHDGEVDPCDPFPSNDRQYERTEVVAMAIGPSHFEELADVTWFAMAGSPIGWFRALGVADCQGLHGTIDAGRELFLTVGTTIAGFSVELRFNDNPAETTRDAELSPDPRFGVFEPAVEHTGPAAQPSAGAGVESQAQYSSTGGLRLVRASWWSLQDAEGDEVKAYAHMQQRSLSMSGTAPTVDNSDRVPLPDYGRATKSVSSIGALGLAHGHEQVDVAAHSLRIAYATANDLQVGLSVFEFPLGPADPAA